MQIKSAEGEKNQWKTNDKTQPQQQRNLDSGFMDWLHNYKPFSTVK